MPKRQLVALLFCDLVGYGSVTNADEKRALELLEEYRAIVRRFVPFYGGRENKTIGDAFMVEFGSAIDAVLCAIEVQTCLYERNLGVPTDRRILARVGIHLGDVVLAENDSFGEGVNVAARIEGFSDPGGICVSRAVADQLSPYPQIRLRCLGKKHLKHIARPATLYKVVLPWERRAIAAWWRIGKRAVDLGAAWAKKPRPERTGDMVLETLAAFVLAVFVYLGARTVQGFLSYDLQGPVGATPRTSLIEGWQYATAPFEAEPEIVAPYWQAFHRPAWQHSDELSKPYWLRLVFRARAIPSDPAIVLGPICGAHRAYLNGKLIGGSNHTYTLAYYTFDKALLARSGDNTLLVKVNPKPSITPGIVGLPTVPSFLGDFNDVSRVVTRNEAYLHVVQNIYLVLALLCFLATSLFYVFNRHDKKYLYFSLFLLLGAMSLLHSNGFVFGYLDFRLQRAFRLFGLSLSSLILLATYLRVRGRREGEIATNLAAVTWCASLSLILLLPEASAAQYLARWNTVLGITTAFTVIWVVTLFNYRIVKWLRDPNERDKQWQKLRYETVIFSFGALIAMLAFSSMKVPALRHVLPYSLQQIFFTLGTTYPFWFAACIVGLGIYDYIQKNRSAWYQHRAEDLLLAIADTLRHEMRGETAVVGILEKVTTFIRAERSTVYLLEEHDGEPCLRAHSILGSQVAKPLIRKVATVRHGILGYICESKAPLLIRDIASDTRFQDHVQRRKSTEADSYRTNSCMLFPLVIGNRLLGILTIADKKGNGAFSERDFSILHVVAKDLAVVIQTERLAGGRPAEGREGSLALTSA